MPEVKKEGNSIKGESMEDLRSTMANIKKNRKPAVVTEQVTESFKEDIPFKEEQEEFVQSSTVEAAQKFQSSNLSKTKTLAPKDLELKNKFKQFFKKKDIYKDIVSGQYTFKVKNLDGIHFLEVEQIQPEDVNLEGINKLYRKTFAFFVRALVSIKDADSGEEISVEDIVGVHANDPYFYDKLETFIIESLGIRTIVDILNHYSEFFTETSGDTIKTVNADPTEGMPEKKS